MSLVTMESTEMSRANIQQDIKKESLDYWHNDSNLFNRAKMNAEPIIDSKDYKEETIRRVFENRSLNAQDWDQVPFYAIYQKRI